MVLTTPMILLRRRTFFKPTM